MLNYEQDKNNLELLQMTTDFTNIDLAMEYFVCSLAMKNLTWIELSYLFMITKDEVIEILHKNGFVLLDSSDIISYSKAENVRDTVMYFSETSGLVSEDVLHKIFHLTLYDTHAKILNVMDKYKKR